MEVAGGLASVVGIVGFTGQAITGLLKLRQLLKDAAAAKDTVNNVLETIDLLSSTLKEVERVVGIIETLPQHQINGRAILETGALKYQTKACAKDFTEWILVAKKLDPRSRKGIKAFLRKIKVAAGKEDLQLLGEAISSHQQRIAISLSLLGSSLDVLGIHRLDKIDQGLGGLTEAHLQLNNLVNGNQQKTNVSKSTEESLVALLDSLLGPDKFDSENPSETSLHSIHESISSLASSVSELVAKLSSDQQDEKPQGFETSPDQQSPATPQWGCDAISGIEEAFDGDKCIYCSKPFADPDTSADWRARGRHLVREHHFGACNLGTTFSSWMGMIKHLLEFHDFKPRADESYTGSNHFLCPRRSLPLFERNVEDKTQFVKVFDELPPASHILSAEFASAIVNPHSLDPELQLVRNCFGDRASGYAQPLHRLVKKRIHSLLDEGKIDSILPLMWQIRQKLVCLIEELVIDEKDEVPRGTWFFPRFGRGDNIVGVHPTRINLGSMLLMLDAELEEMRWMDNIEPLFIASPVLDTADNLALNDRINPWLLNVFRYSSNTRIILAKEFGPGIKDPSDIYPWISTVIQFWYTDGTAISLEGLYLVSDGAIDSIDNPLGSPVPSLKSSCYGEPSSPEFSDFGRYQNATFTYGGSSASSAASLKSNLAAKRSPRVVPPIRNLPRSSSGGSLPCFTALQQVLDFDVSESSDEDKVEDAVNNDDDSSDWQDSDEGSGNPHIDNFPHIDSRPNLTSRRPLITTLPHQDRRAAALGKQTPKDQKLSWKKRKIRFYRNKRTLSQSIGSDSDDEDLQPVMLKGVNEVGSSAKRLRKKVGKHASLIFDDPPRGIEEEDENPEVTEIEDDDEDDPNGQCVDKELPYYRYVLEDMNIDSE